MHRVNVITGYFRITAVLNVLSGEYNYLRVPTQVLKVFKRP